MYRHIATLGDFTRSPTSDEAQDFTKPLSGLKVGKKIGYSTFPKEIFPVPKVWAEKTGDLVFYRLNKEGTSGSDWMSGVLTQCLPQGDTLRVSRTPSCSPRISQSSWRSPGQSRLASSERRDAYSAT